MKAGLTTSVVMHATLLGFGLFSLSAPKAFEVSDVEALPVEIISITQIQQGDKKAPKAERPAPNPTQKPADVPDAQKLGDNKLDTSAPPTPTPTPKEVKAAAAPPPSPEPLPKPADQPKPEPVKQAEPELTPVPATEVTPQPQPKQEVKPDPVAETIVADNAEAEAVKLPENAPSPAARPQPPKAETAKAPDRKDTEKPAEKQAAKPKSEEKDFNADEVAALLNKEKASGGGAKRSTDQAALGNERQSNASKLSQSEEDSLRGQVQRCWLIPAGAADAGDLKVSVRFKLDPAGELQGSPEIVSGGGGEGVQRAAAEAARRAVARCAPYNLPAEKYETWAEVIVNFDPSEMF